jgi:Delta3-Delta2-enoyl-CoA isomerase
MPTVEVDDGIAVMHLGDGENSLNTGWVDSLTDCLVRLEQDPPRAVVTTAGGKCWSTGLDLQWMAQDPDGAQGFLDDVERMLARMLLLPTPTVAAVQGHAFAAGAMLALAHDYRVMRSDRGYFCLPEIDLPLPFTVGMSRLIQAKLDPKTAHEAMTTGRRYGGTEAAQLRIVDEALAEPDLLPRALELAGAVGGKHAATLAEIKRVMYAAPAAALRHEWS